MDRVGELTTAEWQDVMRQAGKLGVLQVHLSGSSAQPAPEPAK